jgi:HK97 family phage major capsid protein
MDTTKIEASLGKIETGIEANAKKMTEIESGFAQVKTLPDELTKLRSDIDAMRKAQLVIRESGARRNGQVSDDCARHIAARICLQAEGIGALEKQGMDSHRRDTLVGVCKEILGVQAKTALTTSDIPMPIEYSGQVVELVSQFSAARMYGTVYPLGTASAKLPRLGTDTTFGLIAASATVTEKSPTVTFVTFTPEKFGGLVRVPSEIDADSIVPLGQFLARYCARQIAYIEDVQVFASTGAGSGINGTAEGLTKNTITNSKVTQMASTKTKYSDLTLAHCRTVRTVPDAAALRTAAYYMHPTMEQQLAGFNTAGDKPYNPQSQIQGTGTQPFVIGPTLDGFPVRFVDVLPAYSTSANVSKVCVLFGDVSYQYLGVRPGISMDVSKDVFFATDEIAVRCLERMTTGLMALGAVAGIQTAAS